jgi:hypothetical protein
VGCVVMRARTRFPPRNHGKCQHRPAFLECQARITCRRARSGTSQGSPCRA